MNKRESKNPITLILIIAAISAAVLCLVILFVWRDSVSSQRELEKENELLKQEMQEIREGGTAGAEDPASKEPSGDAIRPEGAYDYLAIGNSITENPPYGGIWWGDWGMAASSAEKDYVHLVKAGIEESYPVCNLQVLNFRVWEQPFYEREDHLELLDGYLSGETDLVTVQLGENITDMGDLNADERKPVLTRDYGNLINYIKSHAPNAKVIVLGSYFEEDQRDSVVEEVCRDKGAVFLSLKEIQKDEYKVGGGTVMGDDGEEHTIQDPLVGLHPNDQAMAYIADRILENLGVSGEEKAEAPEGLIPPATEEEEPGGNAEALLNQMSLDQKVYQMMILAPEQLTGYELVTASGDATKEALTDYPVGGIIYFEPNLETPEQTKTMLENAQKMALEIEGVPLFLCVDEEGGKVSRIAKNEAFGVEEMPYLNTVTEKEEAHRIGKTIGESLKELGFNVDFAPVADVITDPENSPVRERSFGSDPFQVTELCGAYTEGLHESGILATWKHFPGHGGTKTDTHDGMAIIDKTWEELRETEEIPFSQASAKGADLIMTCHVSVPDVCGDNRPASLSKEMVTGKLREELGFEGLIVSDALNMGAVTESYSSAEAGKAAVVAGSDLVLMPEDFKEAAAAIIEAVQSGEIPEERINESVLRILKAKEKL